MQFTAESALAGNDIATLPDFPAEIRAPTGTLAGVSGFQLNFSSSEIFTAGDEPNVLVAMNPGGAAGQHRGCAAQRRDHRRPRGVHRVQRQARRLQDQSAHRSFARQIPGHRSRCDQAHVARAARNGAEQSRRVPMPQHVRARDAVVAVSAADREHAQLPREPLQEDARDSRGQRQGAQGRLQLRRDDRDVRELLRSAGRANRAGPVSQYHRQQRDRAGIRGGGGEIGTSAVPGLVSDHARQRRAARTRGLQEFPGLYVPGRGRDCRRVRRDRRGIRRMRLQSPRLRAPA